MNELKWRELVERTRRGDRKAFEILYRETNRSVYFTALKLLADEEKAKDVMQDTFLTAIEKLNALRDGANFPKWVNRIAINKCRRYFRKPAEESLDERYEQGFEIKDDESFLPEEYVSNEVKRRVVTNIITRVLSDVQRQTVIMYYYNELSLEEIARVMGCPVKTVSSRLCSAREKIKEAVLVYEKKHGDRLHAVAPLPILAVILRMEAEKLSVPDIPLEVFTKALIDAVSKAAAVNSAAGTAAGASSASAGTAAAGGSAVTHLFTGKIIAGITAVVIAGGGVTAAVIHNQNKKAEENQYSSVSETVTEMPTAPDAAGSPEQTDSLAPYQELNRVLDPEMEAKLNELRANGAETIEVKWGTQTPIPFTEYSTGEKTEIRCNGTFTYFPELNGDMGEDKLKMYVVDSMSFVILHRSGYLDADQLPGATLLMRDEVIARLANEHGILLNGLTINSVTKSQTAAAVTTAAQAEQSPAENAENSAPALIETGYSADNINLYGMKMFIPAEDIHSGRKTADGRKILQYRKSRNFASWYEVTISADDETDVDMTKAYAIMTGTGFMDKEPLTAEGAKQYFFGRIEGVRAIVNEHCSTSSIREVEAETSETVKVAGKDFLRETGIIHCSKYGNSDEIVDVAYAAYYGTPGFTKENFENAPVIWIAYSDHTDDETKAVLAELADKGAKDAEMNG